MTFAEEMYKQREDSYRKEKDFVHNLFIIGLIKDAMRKNKNTRCFNNWKYAGYTEFGEGRTCLSPDMTFWFQERINPGLNWNVIKSLIEEEVSQADLGLKTFNVTIIESNQIIKEKDYGVDFFGRPKYKSIPVLVREISLSASW